MNTDLGKGANAESTRMPPSTPASYRYPRTPSGPLYKRKRLCSTVNLMHLNTQYSSIWHFMNASMILLSVEAYLAHSTQENKHSFQSSIDNLSESSRVGDGYLATSNTTNCFSGCTSEQSCCPFPCYGYKELFPAIMQPRE